MLDGDNVYTTTEANADSIQLNGTLDANQPANGPAQYNDASDRALGKSITFVKR